MAQRHFGLTDAVAANYLEALRVCLDRHHVPSVVFQLMDPDHHLGACVTWAPTDERTKGAWANELDTTRDGAYACVLAAVELLFGLVAISRSETETGSDYYIAEPGASPDDLELHIRLEVSGVDHGDTGVVARRLRDKVKQTRKGNSDLPAMAGVVGFLIKEVRLAQS